MALSLILMQLQGQIYVKQGSNGNGTSWQNAYGDVQQALEQAQEGDQIWVAKGIYTPTKGNDRFASFNIPNGVELYGGFAGNESDIFARNFDQNPTILSGEIGNPDLKEDNSFTVVYFNNVSDATIINGFTITGGYADGTGEKGDMRRCGGGLFNDGSNGTSNPVIENCIFKSNYGRDGGAIYSFANNGEASASILDCSFLFNKADHDGGAINNDGNNGKCNPIIKNCAFINNEASYGAGILNQGTFGETNPLIAYCDFSSNVSYIEGSSIYNFGNSNGKCNPVIRDCIFKDNISSIGSDIGGTKNIAAEKVTNSERSPLRLSSGGR